jgi:plasmid rolling circle replication initiator protein Rep
VRKRGTLPYQHLTHQTIMKMIHRPYHRTHVLEQLQQLLQLHLMLDLDVENDCTLKTAAALSYQSRLGTKARQQQL